MALIKAKEEEYIGIKTERSEERNKL